MNCTWNTRCISCFCLWCLLFPFVGHRMYCSMCVNISESLCRHSGWFKNHCVSILLVHLSWQVTLVTDIVTHTECVCCVYELHLQNTLSNVLCFLWCWLFPFVGHSMYCSMCVNIWISLSRHSALQWLIYCKSIVYMLFLCSPWGHLLWPGILPKVIFFLSFFFVFYLCVHCMNFASSVNLESFVTECCCDSQTTGALFSSISHSRGAVGWVLSVFAAVIWNSHRQKISWLPCYGLGIWSFSRFEILREMGSSLVRDSLIK